MTEDDKTLDDFFAKKDKSKKPKKTKKAKSDDSVKALSDSKTKADQGDDWKDFEERKEKDYSNLKIQDLQIIEDNAKEEAEEQNQNNDSEDEDGVKKNSGEPTIWNVPAGQSEPPKAEVPDIAGTHNVVGGKYVPPSVKRSNQLGASQPISRRKPLAAPDIKSSSAFPTLSAANEDISHGSRSSDFEVVKKGTRSNDARVTDGNRPRLDLGNRYDSLRS